MEIIALLPIGCFLILAIYTAVTYNALVTIRNHIKDAWADIDTELKRRHDLIPNLVETVRGYASHERETLEHLIELRSQCLSPSGSNAASEQLLASGVNQVLALAERYPDLKANGQFLELQHELVNTEDRIQAARRFHNGNIRDYRNKTQSFPSNLVASLFGFSPDGHEFFQVSDDERASPKIDLETRQSG